MEPTLIKCHAFTSAENFAQFNANYWLSYPKSVQDLLTNYQNQYKTYVNACCNKQTWLKMLISAYIDFLKNNSQNPEFSATIKGETKCDKIMFFQVEKLIVEI
jgi:hypothetical protein